MHLSALKPTAIREIEDGIFAGVAHKVKSVKMPPSQIDKS
jgi:hypothetical protein